MSQNDAETLKSGVEDGTEPLECLVPYREVIPDLYVPIPEKAIRFKKLPADESIA